MRRYAISTSSHTLALPPAQRLSLAGAILPDGVCFKNGLGAAAAYRLPAGVWYATFGANVKSGFAAPEPYQRTHSGWLAAAAASQGGLTCPRGVIFPDGAVGTSDEEMLPAERRYPGQGVPKLRRRPW